MNRRELIDFVLAQTPAFEDYPFFKANQKSSAQTAVVRHHHNRKIIALVMEKDGHLLLNLKLTPTHVAEAVHTRGVLPGYHMNKTHWITVVINETDVSLVGLKNMIGESVELTRK